MLGSIRLVRWLGSIGIVGSGRGCGFFRFSRFFLGFAFFCLSAFFILFRERFYEGLISIWNSGVCLGR